MRKDIVFVNGIVKSREKYLVGTEKLSRMTEAENAEEAFRILRESGFGGDDANFTVWDYEKLIEAERETFYAFLREYADSSVIDCLLAKNDFHNAECAVRARHVSCGEEMFMPSGNVDVNLLRNGGNVPEYLAKPMAEAEASFADGTATGVSVGMIFLRAYYAYVLKRAKFREQREAYRYEIDAKNISAAIRSGNAEKARQMYVEGGKISFDKLDEVANGSEKATEKLEKPYVELIELGLRERAEGKALVQFERAAESFTMKKLKERRFETEGVIPLLLYVNYKLNELKNVKIVLVGKLCNADKESIKMRIRECYAG